MADRGQGNVAEDAIMQGGASATSRLEPATRMTTGAAWPNEADAGMSPRPADLKRSLSVSIHKEKGGSLLLKSCYILRVGGVAL